MMYSGHLRGGEDHNLGFVVALRGVTSPLTDTYFINGLVDIVSTVI